MSKIKIFSLGGLNEIGKNMYVVDVDNDLFIFDAGLKYADDKMLGIDYIIPNFDFIRKNVKRIKGIFITHGHPQQLGALVDILTELPEIKIYGAAFTLEILKTDLESEKISTENLIEIKANKKLDFGHNSIFPISLTHSVPDALGYVLNTQDGAIFYTGNFVFDPTMFGNYKTDIGKLAYVGKQGVLCLMSESLYADKQGFTSPNHRAAGCLREIIYKHNDRILFNVFNTQIYRLQELFNEIKLTDRKVVVLGKNLQEIIFSCIDHGYIVFDKNRILNIHHVNDEGIIVLIADDREKPFSNISRIIKGFDKFVQIHETDTVVFVSPIYEGMELRAAKIFDAVSKLGATLIPLSSKKYLGLHASSEDLMLMLDLMKPKYYFPVIGEYRHQVANAEVARHYGYDDSNILLKLNGQVVTFVGGKLVETDEVIKVDDVLVDGKSSGDIGELVLKDREALGDNGIVIVCVTLDKTTKQVIAGPEILTRGFIYVRENTTLLEESAKIALEVVRENTKPKYVEFNKVKNGIRDRLGKYLYQETECKPMILVVLQEV